MSLWPSRMDRRSSLITQNLQHVAETETKRRNSEPSVITGTQIKHLLKKNGDKSSCLESVFDSLKCYWSNIKVITKQSLVLDYYHKETGYLCPWFERIKESSILKLLNMELGQTEVYWSPKEKSTLQDMKEARAYICLISSFNSKFIETVKARNKENASTMDIINDCESVSTAINLLQNCIQSTHSTTETVVMDIAARMKTATDEITTMLEDAEFDSLKLSEQMTVYDIDLLCAILGLKFEFGKPLKKIHTDMWLHQSQLYHVLNWIENNNKKNNQASVAIEEICNIGFTEEKAAHILRNISEEFTNHQTPLYWATAYIENMFQNHPLLSQCNDYPYSVEENIIIPQNIELQRSLDGEDSAEIHIINVSDVRNLKVQAKIIQFMNEKTMLGHRQYFHGTTHTAAVNILIKGIDLSEGNRHQDFSNRNGFYLSYKFSHAKKWATSKSDQPAILVFSVPDQLFEDTRPEGLDVVLNSSDTPEVKKEKQNKWKAIVKFCRSGSKGNLPEGFENYPFIIGPMSNNGAYVGEDPEPKEMNQLCIKKTDFAQSFGQVKNIICAVFYKTN